MWSLGNRPEESELLWNIVAYGLGLFNLGTMGMILWAVPEFSPTVLFSGIGSLATFAATSFVQGQLFQIVVRILYFMQ